MIRRLFPYARLSESGRLPWNPMLWYPRGEKERLQVLEELWIRLGTHNPSSSVHREDHPSEANNRLYAALFQLPLHFARRVLDYTEHISQPDRDVLQAAIRYGRSAESANRVLNDAEVRRLELYLNAIPVFSALTSGDPIDVGREIVNHAERTDWEAHKNPRAVSYPSGYFFYTVVWQKTPLPDNKALLWLDRHALELARYRRMLEQRGSFNREFCELLLSSSLPAISSGML